MNVPVPHGLTRLAAAGIVVGLLTAGCASSPKTVPFTVQSDPLGAYVVFQTQAGSVQSDWVYLGNTPVTTTRNIDPDSIKDARSVALRVMKEGYFDQTKTWVGAEFLDEVEEKGRIYWNPRLVPSPGDN